MNSHGSFYPPLATVTHCVVFTIDVIAGGRLKARAVSVNTCVSDPPNGSLADTTTFYGPS